MKTIAAVLIETGKPLVLEELEIPKLKPGQLLVEVKFTGVCRNQLAECRGFRGKDPYLPHCLGHEGSGVVLEVGEGVVRAKPGDRVLLSWMKGPGAEVPTTVYSSARGNVNAGAITTFAQHTVVSENRVTPLPPDLGFSEAAFFGCAVPTGVGAVINTAQAKAGSSAVIFGAGGVGLSAVAGASLAGCSKVIAVDVNPAKFEAARAMGATHCIAANGNDVVADVRNIVGGGADIAIEASGHPEAMNQALAAVRNLGGIAVVLGNARFGDRLSIDPRELNHGKQLRGSWGGDNKPDFDFPRYFALFASGKLKLDAFMGSVFSLKDINAAIDALEAGTAVRPLIDLSLGC